ncbi:hypothetical protein ACHAXR_002313 [Thalassiosira sp. AJA248-18]
MFLFGLYSELQIGGGVESESEVHTMAQAVQRKKSSLANGCHHIFLDIGANIGIHSRFLFEPHAYPYARVARQVFDEQFGKERDNRDICSFAFEPNPAHAERHKKLTESYNKLGWRYNYIHAGVSDEDGNLTFYHNHDEGDMEWGFSDHDLKTGGKMGVPVTVPTIRLATWLKDEIKDRELPFEVHGNYTTGPRVVAKMDIESQEYRVLPDVFFNGVLCETVDYLFGELHAWKLPVDYPSSPVTGRGGLHFNSMREARDKINAALVFFGSVKDCRTTFRELDDEAYHTDGVPFLA